MVNRRTISLYLPFTIYYLPTFYFRFSVFGRRFSLSFSHFCLASPLRSPGIVSTGMLLSAQNLRHNRKRASCCPVSSEISFATFGFSSATFTLPSFLQLPAIARATARPQCSKFFLNSSSVKSGYRPTSKDYSPLVYCSDCGKEVEK